MISVNINIKYKHTHTYTLFMYTNPYTHTHTHSLKHALKRTHTSNSAIVQRAASFHMQPAVTHVFLLSVFFLRICVSLSSHFYCSKSFFTAAYGLGSRSMGHCLPACTFLVINLGLISRHWVRSDSAKRHTHTR